MSGRVIFCKYDAIEIVKNCIETGVRERKKSFSIHFFYRASEKTLEMTTFDSKFTIIELMLQQYLHRLIKA